MTIHLIRHGSAGHRSGQDPGDSERHLDGKGLRQAESLARVLGGGQDSDHPHDGAGISAIFSSPLPRCIETVEPLAKRYGLPVQPVMELAEGASVEEAWRFIEATVGGLSHGDETCQGNNGIVMCSHGDVIPALIMRAEVRGMTPPQPSGFAKASIWSLSGWTGTTFGNVRYQTVTNDT